jgi:hypothetical protein
MGGFEPERLSRSVIAPPLRERIASTPPGEQGADRQSERVVIELNLNYVDRLTGARERVMSLLEDLRTSTRPGPLDVRPLGETSGYLAATMTPEEIRELARRDREAAAGNVTHRAVFARTAT